MWFVSALFFTLVALAVLFRSRQVSFLPSWAPANASEALGLAWQVQTSIAAIAFAGLALVIQLASNPPVAIRSSREVLYRETLFRSLLLFAGASNVTLGIIAIWLASDGGAIIGFLFCFVVTMLFIGLSYFRAAEHFLDERRAAVRALNLLQEKLSDGLYKLDVMARANTRLADLFPGDSLIRARSRASGSTDGIPLVIVGQSVRLEDVNYRLLQRIAAKHLHRMWLINFPAEATQEAPPKRVEGSLRDTAPAILLDSRINEVVPAGGHIFTLTASLEADDPRVRVLENDLRGCIRLRDGDEDDDERLRGELVTLKDSLLSTIAAGTTGSLRQGLDVYSELFNRILASTGRIQDPSILFSFSAYGPYWRWLQRDVREIAVSAIEVLGRRGLYVTVDHAYSLCKLAFKSGDYDALREFLGLYPAYLTEVLGQSSDDALAEYVAVSLQNLTQLFMRAEVRNDMQARRLVEEISAGVFAEMMRICVDTERSALFERLLAYFGVPSDLIGGFGAADRKASESKAAALLAVLAWTLYRAENLHASQQLEDIAAKLLRLIPAHLVWAAYVEVGEGVLGQGRPWSRWELQTKIPLQVHMMAFDSYLASAALMVAAAVGLVVPPGVPSADDASRAGSLLNAFELAGRLSRFVPSFTFQGERLEQQLKALVDQRRSAEKQAIRESAIESERVERFISALREAMDESSNRLSNTFSRNAPHEIPGDGTKLYLNTLVPREFFVSSERVLAEPEMLASNAAYGMIRGENKFIVRSLVDGLAWQDAGVAEIARRAEALKEEASGTLFLVVLNSWELADALGFFRGGVQMGQQQGMFVETDDGIGACVACDMNLVSPLLRSPQPLDGVGEWQFLRDHGVAAVVRDYSGESEEPVAQVVVGVALEWTERPEGVVGFRISDTVAS
ncbi:hypothetical protein [Micromonospora rhizosphaerae]|uniref:hypothetical protein n=1 Tax=Micromonospora rhizosphaerae TaxID=568872 RepID=UPI00114C8E38|nr:hypothetical protein [Micromonospora rhizosphaerae]